MKNDYLVLGKIKKSILEKISLPNDEDREAYVLSQSLNELAQKYPDDYLAKIEGMKEMLNYPDYVSKGKKKINFYRLAVKNKKFYLTQLVLEKKEKWIFKGLKAICYPYPEENELVRLNK